MAAVLEDKDGIRFMCEEDIERVMSIETAEYEFGWTAGIFRDCLRVGYIGLVYVADGQIVGYGIAATRAGECHILNLCVSGEYTRRGIARALLDRVLSMARRMRVHSAYLEVRPSNHTALRLYLRNGFRQIGIRRDYYPAAYGREDALVLGKNVTDDPPDSVPRIHWL